MPSGRAVRLSGWPCRSLDVVRRGCGRSVVPVSSPILDTCRRRRTLRQGSSEGNERAPAFHPGTWMHQCLQLVLPAAGLLDVDSDPPRVGALVFKARNSSEQFRRFVGCVDGQQNRGAPRVKRDNDAVSLGLPALQGVPGSCTRPYRRRNAKARTLASYSAGAHSGSSVRNPIAPKWHGLR
jgi:hypothetical protein